MAKLAVLQPRDLNAPNLVPAEDVKKQLHSLERVLKVLFSKENLCTDHFLLYNMTPDLWIPVSLILNLEPISLISCDKKLIRLACKNAGLEHSVEYDTVRPRLEIARTTVILRLEDRHPEEVQMICHDQGYCSIVQDTKKTWLINLVSEELTLECEQKLRDAGLNATIQSEHPYLHLLSKLQKSVCFINPMILNKLLDSAPVIKMSYSEPELVSIFNSLHVSMPISLKLVSNFVPIIRKQPNVTLEVSKRGVKKSKERLPRVLLDLCR
jgi:hypothetical protein